MNFDTIKTGTVPAIYDDGTHYVSTHPLTLEILKKLNDTDYIQDEKGDYTGGASSRGPRHEKGDWKRKDSSKWIKVNDKINEFKDDPRKSAEANSWQLLGRKSKLDPEPSSRLREKCET